MSSTFQISLFGGQCVTQKSSSPDIWRKKRLLEKKIEMAEHGYNPREIEILKKERARLFRIRKRRSDLL